MIPNMPTVDTLADIRAQIRNLKEIEQRLRDTLIARPHETTGVRHVALIDTKRLRRFDPKLLPLSVYNDDRYWRSQVSTTIRVLPIEPEGGRPCRGARHSMPQEATCKAGLPPPSQGTARHNVPPPQVEPFDETLAEDYGPSLYKIEDDFWDRLR